MTSNLFGRCLFLLAASALSVPAQQLAYQVETNPPAFVSPGSTVSLPSTNLGGTGSVAIQILNPSAVSVPLNAIGVSGSGFQLTQVPPLPTTLTPGSSRTITVSFTPTQAGTANGSLVVNSDTFPLSGVGLAPQLVFSYVTAGTTVTLGATNAAVVFSPIIISQTAQLVFDVKNTGTLPALISNIGISQVNGPFAVVGLPPLPVTVAPGADFQFTVTFQPTALGFSNGTLQIDTTTISLIGSGTAPPALPPYTIGGIGSQVTPRSQPKITLTLGSPYPVAIAGTLTLTTSGSLPNDPAVQFSSGGQTASFVIPANSTSAVFGNSGTGIAFQTGTVASTITVTPSFTTQAGQVNLTPATPTTLQATIAPAAPTLTGIELTGETATGFSIVVTGFTTTRTLTTWTVQFATVPGFSMAQSQFTLNIQQVGGVWFQSSASQAFGGQFSITVPFTFQGTLPSGAPVLSALASVSVGVSNELGSSNTVQAKLP